MFIHCFNCLRAAVHCRYRACKSHTTSGRIVHNVDYTFMCINKFYRRRYQSFASFHHPNKAYIIIITWAHFYGLFSPFRHHNSSSFGDKIVFADYSIEVKLVEWWTRFHPKPIEWAVNRMRLTILMKINMTICPDFDCRLLRHRKNLCSHVCVFLKTTEP